MDPDETMMTHASIRSATRLVAAACLGAAWAGSASAQAIDKFWAVTGVGRHDTLAVRELPIDDSKVVASVPAAATGLPRGICVTTNPQLGDSSEWCRVTYEGVEGWVERRFLRSDTTPRLPIYAPALKPDQARYEGFAAAGHKWNASLAPSSAQLPPCWPLMHGDELVLVCKRDHADESGAR